ncbi:hypothetical protein GCM10009682_56740 [Luedemannella flava]|uniref:CBM6 domain-containing protein n=2 Tax=Luedemannella flava TaxID=349316 RepID=A0ABP4YTR8_9ACTN
MWRLRTTGERMRLILAGGAAVIAALTLVLLVVDPDGARGRDQALRGTAAALAAAPSVPVSPSPRSGVHATAGRPTRTAAPTTSRRTAASPTPTVTARASAAATTRAAPFAVTLEAEAGDLGGIALRLTCGCSGGAVIGQLGSGFIDGFQWRSGWLTFDGISVPADGDYTLTVHYRASRDRDLRISVNSGSSETVRCDEASAGTVTATVRLVAGRNTIRLFNDHGRAPDIDKIKVSR